MPLPSTTRYYRITMSSLSERIMNSSDALCKTYNFAFNFVLHISPWLMVAVAMEMTIAMRWPLRVYAMCTLERANNVVMLLIILIVCLDINYFWTWGLPSREVGCRHTEEFSEEFRDTIWPAMTNIIQFLTPLIIVSLCFFITAATMISRRPQAQKGIERELKKYFLELNTLRDFRVICLILSLIFMCLTLFTITITFVDFLEVKGYIMLDDEEYMSYSMKMMMLKTLDMTMYSLFYSLKIFIYVGCSSTFRSTLKQGFFWLRLRLRRAIFKVPKPGRNQRQLQQERNIMANHQSKPFIEKSSCSVAKPEEDSLSDEDTVMVNIKRENISSSLSPTRISLRDCDTFDHPGTDV